MVSVGYMDPGNWATDIAGGASFGYSLIWVLLLSNLMALLLQTLSARLGLVTGHDLAQACREEYPVPVRLALFVLCEIAIAATDLAEALGSAIGINLLFGVPIFWAIFITGFDVLLLLLIQKAGIRKMEAFIVLLISTIGLCYVVEIFLSRPVWTGSRGVLSGFVPNLGEMFSRQEMLFVAIGIIGATVMPHNLYLHSALVQSRNVPRSAASVAQACRYNLIDSFVALNGAFFVNAAILIVAAATFWTTQRQVTEIQEAHKLLGPLLGTSVAPVAFAVALICSGQSSTVTGTLAGQITMEGFLRFRLRPWLRRLISRVLAIGPAMVVVGVASSGGGEGGNRATFMLLVLSQVILSLQLPFAIVPLVKFTSSRVKMGPFASRWWVRLLAWLAAAVIIGLNVKLVADQVAGWAAGAGALAWLVWATAGPAMAALAALLAWMTFRREKAPRAAKIVSPDQVAQAAVGEQKHFRRIGVALEARPTDSAMLAEAIAMARVHQAELVLMHVVEGVGGQWYGPQTGDSESREDEQYITRLADRLRDDLAAAGVAVRTVLGYGDVPSQIVKLARQEQVDLMVLGGHGHGRVSDVICGETISSVRHALNVPTLSVRG